MRRVGGRGDPFGRRRAPLGQAAVTTWIAALHRQAPRRVLLVALALLVLVALADGVSGANYSFSIFYLLVVARVSATGRRSYLIPTALVTAATWSGVEAWNRGLEHPWLPLLWNSTARFAVLYVSALLVAAAVSAARHEREVSRTDALTGLYNRRGFRDLAEMEILRAGRGRGGLSLVYLDVDGFKGVNDVQGHAAGDRLLTQVARVLDGAVRQYDTVARVGGDEFVALLPNVCGPDAVAVGRRAADGVDEMCRREAWPVTVSVGVASFATTPASVDALLEAADALMYDAKRAGRGTAGSTVVGQVLAGVRHVPRPPPDSAARAESA